MGINSEEIAMTSEKYGVNIGRFSRETGLPEGWIREMTRQGLLADRRDRNNFRVFQLSDVAKARELFARRTKRLTLER